MPLAKQLKDIIYNVQPRDEHSVSVMGHDNYLEPHHCTYVYGGPDQEDWFHCGHPRMTEPRSQYCESHHTVCYGRRRRRRSA